MRHKDIKRIADFLLGGIPELAQWPEGRLEAWVEWYFLDARAGILTHRGQIVGVALARLLKDPATNEENYRHEPDGDIIWVDAIHTTHPHLIRALLAQARTRFGHRRIFAGTLRRRANRITQIPQTKIESLS
jgi:hypothetical protein